MAQNLWADTLIEDVRVLIMRDYLDWPTQVALSLTCPENARLFRQLKCAGSCRNRLFLALRPHLRLKMPDVQRKFDSPLVRAMYGYFTDGVLIDLLWNYQFIISSDAGLPTTQKAIDENVFGSIDLQHFWRTCVPFATLKHFRLITTNTKIPKKTDPLWYGICTTVIHLHNSPILEEIVARRYYRVNLLMAQDAVCTKSEMCLDIILDALRNKAHLRYSNIRLKANDPEEERLQEKIDAFFNARQQYM